jgi:hypothetical protein
MKLVIEEDPIKENYVFKFYAPIEAVQRVGDYYFPGGVGRNEILNPQEALAFLQHLVEKGWI